jgi:N-acyl amino acid synthase FeeM
MAVADASISAVRFSERICKFLERVEFKEATSEEELEAIYRVRYDGYLRQGYIDASPARRLTDALDGSLPNTWTFGVYVDGALSGTIRIHVIRRGYPDSFARQLFPDILDPEIEAGRTIVEPSKFVVDREGARHPELAFVIMRLVYMPAVHFGADYIVLSIRPEHQPFYKRMLMFQPLCPPRRFDLFPMPVHLVGVHFPPVQDLLVAKHPYFESTEAERRLLFARDGGPAPAESRARRVVELAADSA